MIKRIFSLLVFISLFAGTALTASAASYQFTRYLSPGLTSDPDVMKLQDLLRTLGFFSLPTSTGNYFSITTNSVKKFQIASNIKPSNGNFGPQTMAQANRLTGILENVATTPPATPSVDPLNYSYQSSKNRNATSTYYGQIRIYSLGGNNRRDPTNEYIVIRNQGTSTEPINLTGFRLVTTSNEEFVIPKAHNLLDLAPTGEVDIRLPMRGYVRIVAGIQPKYKNFRENICAGYFNEFTDFNEEIDDNNCPRPDVRSVSPKLPDHCIRIFESRNSCRTVNQLTIQVPECTAYAAAHFNYQGCLRDNRNRSDFYSDIWHVWMQRNKKFLRYIHDNVMLYDPEGKLVDTFTY